MVIKGASRRNIGFWSKHLTDDTANDRAELIEKRGLAADTLPDMLREMQDAARLTRCENFMYIASFNPCAGEHLTERQWERAYEIFEKQRGIPEGQPRIVYEHEKHGRTHRHVVWGRIDTERMRAFPDALDWKICAAASQQIASALGLERTPGILDREPGTPRPERRPKSWEMFRGMRSGRDPRDIKAEVTALFRASADAGEFVAALERHGYRLLRGDRRDFCIMDSAGDVHSLARRIGGCNAEQLHAFMRGIDRESLPGVAEARASQKRNAGTRGTEQQQPKPRREATANRSVHGAREIRRAFQHQCRVMTAPASKTPPAPGRVSKGSRSAARMMRYASLPAPMPPRRVIGKRAPPQIVTRHHEPQREPQRPAPGSGAMSKGELYAYYERLGMLAVYFAMFPGG